MGDTGHTFQQEAVVSALIDEIEAGTVESEPLAETECAELLATIVPRALLEIWVVLHGSNCEVTSITINSHCADVNSGLPSPSQYAHL